MFIASFLLFILFNGQVTLETMLIGLVFGAGMYAFVCKFMDYSTAKDLRILTFTISIIHYILILVYEILKAYFAVVRVILSRQIRIEPVIVRFKTDLQSKTARVVLANSITLTPGTITVSLEGDEYTVHCLDKSFAGGMQDSVFVQLLRKIERKA